MIENIIKKMEEQIDSDNFEEVQEECIYQIEKENLGISTVEPLLKRIRRFASRIGYPQTDNAYSMDDKQN